MNTLADRQLEPIPNPGDQLDAVQQKHLLQQLQYWQIDQTTQEAQLVRQFKFKNFRAAMEFGNRIGELAEQVNHHPTLLLEWGRVTVRWWTHSIAGLHINDFILAARSDEIFTAY